MGVQIRWDQETRGREKVEMIPRGGWAAARPWGVSKWEVTEVIAEENCAGQGSSKDGVSPGGRPGHPAPEAADGTELEWPQEMREALLR